MMEGVNLMQNLFQPPGLPNVNEGILYLREIKLGLKCSSMVKNVATPMALCLAVPLPQTSSALSVTYLKTKNTDKE